MSAPLPLPNTSNKRNIILKLLSEGTYSTKDIAKIANTTEGYVSKEKSKLKTAGLLVRRDTQVISRTSSHLSIYANNSLINVPQAETESLKILYRELMNGKKPQEIIAEHGFHPDLVESESQRFQRLVENDIEFLQRRFFSGFEQDLLILAANNNTISSLVQKYKNDGILSIDDFMNLTRLMMNEKYRTGEASAFYNLINGDLPDGWEAVKCFNCNKPIMGSIAIPARTLTIAVYYDFVPLSHQALHLSCP